jgi:predicted acyl esterase
LYSGARIPLRDHDHVFLKGHRIVVQVQSTWSPVIDRNLQKFVPSIYEAAAGDFLPATQRVLLHATDALASGASDRCALALFLSML